MERLVPLGNFFFRFRNWIFPVGVLAALLLSQPRHAFGQHAYDVWMDALGVLVALLGLAVRAVTIGYEYIVRGGRGGQVYADKLVQGGIYALTRNPMYVGNGLLVVGCALILNAPVFYLVVLPLTFVAYAAIIAAEEAFLRGKFGAEFDAYCARVNRIVPRVSGFRQAISGMRFNWRRLLHKEYNTLFLALLQIPALCYLDDYLLEGEQALPAREHWVPYVLLWVVLYAVVWIAKKTGRLQPEPPSLSAGK